jgi:hypothetical protein
MATPGRMINHTGIFIGAASSGVFSFITLGLEMSDTKVHEP